MIEQRRHARAPINVPVSFAVKGKAEDQSGLGKDISLGGMFVETDQPAPFGSNLMVQLTLPGAEGPLSLPGVVRWVRDGGMGIQFGLLGALETHLITEIGRKHAARSGG